MILAGPPSFPPSHGSGNIPVWGALFSVKPSSFSSSPSRESKQTLLTMPKGLQDLASGFLSRITPSPFPQAWTLALQSPRAWNILSKISLHSVFPSEVSPVTPTSPRCSLPIPAALDPARFLCMELNAAKNEIKTDKEKRSVFPWSNCELWGSRLPASAAHSFFPGTKDRAGHLLSGQ